MRRKTDKQYVLNRETLDYDVVKQPSTFQRYLKTVLLYAFSSVSVLTFIIFLSLFIGKTFGIFIFAKAAALLGWKMPKKICNAELLLIGMVAGVGLTVSLFVADIAYVEEGVKAAAKMGALLSMLSGFSAFVLSKIFSKS